MDKLTNLELEIMQCVWAKNGIATPAEVVKMFNSNYGREWTLQTVCTYMMRMAGKNYLHYEKKNRLAVYTAQISETDYFNNLSADYSKSWGKGVLKRMAVALIEQNKITDDEIQDLKAYLDELAN